MYSKKVLRDEDTSTSLLHDHDKRECSEWLTTATRHKPSHHDKISDGFITTATSYDEYDGWVELGGSLNNWPPVDHENWHSRHLKAVKRCLRDRHWAYQAPAVLDLSEMRDDSGTQKHRLQAKKLKSSLGGLIR
eukprot:2615626-Pyramimonas_sp.AAC.1